MEIDVFELPPVATNAYLLSDPERGEAVLIDAPYGAWEAVEPILKERGLTLKSVLLTHAHFDHILGAAAFNEQGVPLYLHADDREMLGRLGEQMRWFGLPSDPEPPRIDGWIDSSQPMELLGRSVEVRHTPGHCPGNVTFYFADEGAAFVGDVIFAGGFGRTDLPGGDSELLKRTFIEQIYTLPDATTLYPGHGPRTAVGQEKGSNPLVRVG